MATRQSASTKRMRVPLSVLLYRFDRLTAGPMEMAEHEMRKVSAVSWLDVTMMLTRVNPMRAEPLDPGAQGGG